MSDRSERHRQPRMRDVAAQFGGTESVTTDVPRYDWRDPYHALLSLSWPPFLLGVLGYYLAVNALFGTLYALRPGSVANLPGGDWGRAFFFSVETFGTVGYGAMAPQTTYAHVVATLEIFLGLLSTAVLTGLIFVRFARPRPSMEFSRYVTIAPHDGVPTLSVRLGNRRTGTIYHAEASLTLIRRYETQEGYVQWRALELPLMRSRVQAFSLAWTMRHSIDEASPLYGMANEQLVALDAQIVVSISGTDATLAAPVHAIRAYDPVDLLWDHRFVDVMTVDRSGRTRVEIARLNDVEAVPATATAAVADPDMRAASFVGQPPEA
jgi:inward rectifier potassium channel